MSTATASPASRPRPGAVRWLTWSCATAAAPGARTAAAKDTALANLALHGFNANRIWLELVLLALDLVAWAQMLALSGHEARRWEPKRLRLRLFATAARLVATVRRRLLRFNRTWP